MLSLQGRRLFFAADFLRGVRQVLAFFNEMQRVAEGRRALARMDARMLSDIGLSRGEAMEEVRRRFWDVSTRSF